MSDRRLSTSRLLGLLLPLLVPVLCLCTCLRLEMNSPTLYNQGFVRYDIPASTGLPASQLDAITARLIRYFNSLDATPQMRVTNLAGSTFDLFHDYEVVHLEDVKRLFAFNSSLQALSLLLLLALCAIGFSHGRRVDVAAGLRRGALFTLGLLAVTGTLFVADFDWAFVGFHLVAFDNSFWQLDPSTDFLVRLFPWGFWQDMSLLAGIATGLTAGAILLLARMAGQGDTND